MVEIENEVVFDLEAAGLAYWSKFHCLSYQINDESIETIFDYNKAVKFITDLWQDQTVALIGHNIITYDLPYLFYETPHIPFCRSQITDTLLITKVYLPHNLKHGLETLGNKLSKMGKCPKKVEIADHEWAIGDRELMRQRCETDVKISRAVWDMCKTKPFQKWYQIEALWAPYIVESLALGIPISIKELLHVRPGLQQNVDDIQARYPFKIGSPKQWDVYIYKKYGKKLPQTKKGNPSLNKNNRHIVEAQFPELVDHFTHKDNAKILSFIDHTDPKKDKKKNYIYKHLKVNPHTKQLHIHSDLKYYGTRTLRAAYSSPCVNQFPKETAIRAAVKFNRREYRILGMDVDQLELAWLGYLLKEFGNDTVWKEKEAGLCPKKLSIEALGPELLRMYGTADGSLLSVEELNKISRVREMAKRWNYATIYEQTLGGACDMLLLPQDDYHISAMSRAVEMRFPALQDYKEYLESKVVKGVIRNAYGHEVLAVKRSFGSDGDDDRQTVLNTMMQSSGAAYTRVLFSCILNQLKGLSKDIYAAVYNHDELQCRVPADISLDVIDGVIGLAYADFKALNIAGIPLITGVNTTLGRSWNETH